MKDFYANTAYYEFDPIMCFGVLFGATGFLLLMLLLHSVTSVTVTVHLTHLVCHAIGTKMFLSHGNKVVVSTSEEEDWGSRHRHLKIGASFSHQIATTAASTN